MTSTHFREMAQIKRVKSQPTISNRGKGAFAYLIIHVKGTICLICRYFLGFANEKYFLCSFIDNEERILEIVANYGPVTAAVNALGWQHYISGIIENDCDGTEEKLNHAVEIVGFDRSGSKPHYIVQNSWGTDFGESGFVKIAIGNNVCGIASQISMARLS